MHETKERVRVLLLRGDARVVGRGRDDKIALREVFGVPYPKRVRPRA